MVKVMKHAECHQCKCHLKSESACINAMPTKYSVLSCVSSCFIFMTENVLNTVHFRDLLINRS